MLKSEIVMGTSKFNSLHHKTAPLLLGNVWCAKSAQAAEKAGFKALGTSSHAIAFSLGYADGEQMPFEELLFVIKHIVKSVKIPVSVDLEAGYSADPKVVANHVKQLAELGIEGINIEDGIVVDGKRKLAPTEELAKKIEAIKAKSDIFINARTDTFTTKHPNALKEAIERANRYKEAGADGIFVPLIETKNDLREFMKAVKLPLNVFTTPKLPEYDVLKDLGVSRISHGAKLYDQIQAKVEKKLSKFLKTKDYEVILGQK